ncbi:MAG: FAD-binding oxidoreductase [Acetobacteraceae bacterium]
MSMPVVIVGGGIVGSCTALFLRRLAPERAVVVLERDPTYRFASTTLSCASIRTQFTLPLNVRMSLFGSAFLDEMDRLSEAGIALVRRGYLIVATAAGEAGLRDHRAMQTAQGADVEWLALDALRTRYPWLRTDDLAAATLGHTHEGWFDAYALLRTVRAEAIRQGAQYRHAEAVGLDMAEGRMTAVRTAAGERIAAAVVVNAAGPAAGRLAALAGVALPVAPKKRTVFVLRAPLEAPDMPMLFDTSGAYIRPEGDAFLAGIVPPEAADPDADGDFEPDMALLEDLLWPRLAYRIPALEQLRVQRAWAGHYEVSTLDHNAIIGPHPAIANFLFANGFSGHGVQHAAAAGRAIAELISAGCYQTLDLSPFGYERVRDHRPMPELNVY